MTPDDLRTAVGLGVLAGGATLGILLCPATPYLHAALRPWAIALTLGWLAWRLWRLDQALAQWRRWRVNTPWVLAVAALARPDGVQLGRGFRWEQPHTQALETALALHGVLPVATDSRGGLPALHAVGHGALQPVLLPWTELVGHVDIKGTTRSGKSRALEVLIEQLIGEDLSRGAHRH